MSESPRDFTRSSGPFGWLFDLFSSITFGIFLLTLLFIYSAIGSAGAPIGPGILTYPFILRPDAWVSVREIMEISEFEWFHWWPFDVLIALFCITLTVTTLRRIPLNVVNLGVWMIHTGLIILAIGSVWYFSTKVEGDAPVARRRVVVQVPGTEPVSMTAIPGNRTAVAAPNGGTWSFQVSSITPDWEILSGDDSGKRAYKVSVMVQSPEQMFIRELLAGYPQYTEDLIRSSDPQQPFARAKKQLGAPLVDESLKLSLAYEPQDTFYLMESEALYLRSVGATEWVERPIHRMPRYKDHIGAFDRVWTAPGEALPPLRPLDILVPSAAEDDPLSDVTLHVTDYLRYASIKTERLPGGDRLDPAISVQLADDQGRTQDVQLLAFDPRNQSVGGVLSFQWMTSEAQLESMLQSRPPTLRIELQEEGVSIDAPITRVGGDELSVPYSPIEGSGYAYRVSSFQDGLVIQDRTVSLAIIEIRKGGESFTRWVFDDPALTRDLGDDERMSDHADDHTIDPNIRMTYLPGQRPGLYVLGGPGEQDLRLLRPDPADEASGRMIVTPVTVGEAIALRPDVSFTVKQFAPRSRVETRPLIIPRSQRDRDVGVQASMVRVHLPVAGSSESMWLPYHIYPFERPEEVLQRFPYQPTTVRLADGRAVEMLFSRRRMKLPAPVALDSFKLRTHIGGYTGSTMSVRDWTSVIRFETDGGWGDAEEVSVNAPREFDGFWFFQSQWDPPSAPRGPGDPGSAGLNYTVLGVGNRQGVLVQLGGCILSVIGMIYVFYVKPTIKRRRQERVYAAVAGQRGAAGADRTRERAELAPIGAGEDFEEERSS